jgi:hypothetical protein
MLKTILLATSFIVAAPAFAQDRPATDTQQTPVQTATPADPATPATADAAKTAPTPNPDPATQAAQPSPTTTAQQPATPADPAAKREESAAAQPATGQPATTPDQVAQAVNTQFGTYDKDANGTLNQAEFSQWMGALRKASDPSFEAGSPEGQSWINQAFAATDADKNQSIDKTELTSFLTPKAS